MATRGSSVKQQVRTWLAAKQPAAITEAVWGELLMHLAPVSESYVRDLLAATGVGAMAQQGPHQHGRGQTRVG